ncbi:MAG: hypothetical protein HOW73_46875 [Polyangiaceae bacterium]|nr:hypothetical protein [Polyangiaceae bacterium]
MHRLSRSALVYLIGCFFVLGCGEETDSTPSSGGSSAFGGNSSASDTTGALNGPNGSGGNGGAGGAVDAGPNGCSDLDFVSLGPPYTIVSEGTEYSPKCLDVPAGATVKFEGDFVTHPLSGGVIEDGVGIADEGSPIPSVSSGSAVDVAFPTPGIFGFYCSHHASLGMGGAVRVAR